MGVEREQIKEHDLENEIQNGEEKMTRGKKEKVLLRTNVINTVGMGKKKYIYILPGPVKWKLDIASNSYTCHCESFF